MKKRITTSFIFFLLLSLIQISFGQSGNASDYAKLKLDYINKYDEYVKNSSDPTRASIPPVDPTSKYYVDSEGNMIPAFNNTQGAPFINMSPISEDPESDLINTYTFVQSSSTYTAITGGTVVVSGAGIDDNLYASIPIGFTFNYDGAAYSTCGIFTNGLIWFGATPPLSTDRTLPLASTTAYSGVVVALGYDQLSIAPSELRYQTQGIAPNRTFTVQFANWSSFSVTTDTMNYQIILYETGDSISIKYGSFKKDATSRLPQVGLRGASNADFLDRTTTTDWNATTAGTLNSNTCTLTNLIFPASGLTFSYRPPPPTPMTYVSSTTTQITPGLNITQNSINNQILQVQVVMTGTLTPINMTSMNFNTTGSTNPADFANAKVYYTGSSNVFTTTTLVGTTVSPSGAFSVTGTQVMSPGTNYFWLTFDATAGAVMGDYVDAQVVSLVGSGTMGTQTPTVTDPAGRRQIDNYCRGTVSNNGCLGTGIYITNVTLGTLNNTSTCDPDGNFPYAYSWFGALSTSLEQGVTYPISASTFSSSNPQGFAAWIDWDNNNSFDASEYVAFPLVTSGSPVTTSTFLTVPPSAPLGNHRMRVRNNFSSVPTSAQPCALLSYGETEDYTVNVTPAVPMTYTSSTVTQNNVTGFTKPSLKTEVIGIQIVATGSLTPLSVTSFTLNTNGSTNPSTDISNAKLWSTGMVNSFAATTQYGSTYTSPNGSFVINGSLTLLPGTNYFWLTYDIPLSATTGDVIDAECTALNVVTSRTPTVTAPAGSRIISSSKMSGIYTIPGSYPNFSTAIADLNARGTYGPVTFNVASGFVDTASNLVINTTGTAANPIVFQRFGASPLPNPVITAGVGTSTTTDGIIKLNGADYITIDGIDLVENPANVTPTTQMEWGYALVKPNGTNGCQNVTIKNCNITLNKANTASVGIYSHNHLPTSTATFTVSTTDGANSNNSFANDVITNAYIGIYINGYADVSPFAFYDQNNQINNCNISNYGGTATTAYGIYNIYQNGLIINGNVINSSGGATSTGTLYGMFCSTMSNSDLTISNNTVTIVAGGTTSSIYGINFGNGSAGTTNNINILNNIIQNCTYLTATSGAMYNLYCNATCNNLNVSGNRLIGNIYGAAASTGTTIYSLYNLNSPILSFTMTNNLDSGNVVNGTTSYSTYRMYSSITTQNSVVTGNKVKNNTICGTTAAATSYGIYNSAGTFTCNMSNNEVSNNNLPSTAGHSMYGLYNFATAPVMDYNNNLVTGNTSNGTGTLYGMYYGASAALGSTVNINNNTVTNLQKLTATGTGSIYGIYQGSTPQGTLNINNNTITGFTSAAATLFAGIYQISTPPNYININNNKVGNFTNGGISTIYGIYSTATTTTQLTLAQDSVFNLTSPGSTIYGMYFNSGMLWNIYKNSVSGITSNTGTTAIVYGMYSAIATSGSVNIYDNFISDINATASTSTAPAVSGLFISAGLATTTFNVFYNTIYLKAVSSSVTTFSTAGIYAFTTPVIDLRNNVVVDISTPGPTGGNSVAYRKSNSLLTTYAANSNNNCFYAGTPAANKLLYFDGANSDQTLATYKARVIPRDNVSITENPPFVNGTTAPYDLRILTGTATGLESGGKVISSPISIINDKYSTPRYPNAGYPVGGFSPIAPDIGAHEFGGLNADLTPPAINYTALGIGGTSNRSFNNVTITDASGVNTTVGTRPRCYYKRSTDGNTINDNTSGTDGWKYVESNGTTSPFDFTIDYSLLNGGTGVVGGNTVQYFVVAQDLAGTPNFAQNQAIFTVNPTTVVLAAANCPISSTLSYLINTNSFSGSYNVGTAETYTSLTGATGLFAALNAGTVTGNVTALITTDLTEDGTNQLNALNESGVGGYTVTIAPATGSMKLISGTVANGMIRLNGARRITFDGYGAFSSKYLTFRNMNVSNPTFTFINDAGRDTLKNCIVESGNTSTGTTTAGAILFGTTTGTQGNDSIVINSCDIRDRTDVTGYPAFGIYCSGTTTTVAMYNSNNIVSNCNIYNYFLDAASFTGGIYLNIANTDWTITGNSFYQTATRTVTLGGTFSSIYNNNSANCNNNQITNNYVGGSAPLCAGTPMTYTGAGAYNVYGIQAFVSVLTPTNITGNTIKNINLTTSPAGATTSAFFKAIYAQTGWVNVNNNTIGATTGNDNITLTTNVTTGSYVISILHHTGFGSVNNNTLGSITFNGSSLGTADNYYGINYSNTTAGQTYSINNNLIGSLTTPNSIQQTKTVTGTAFRCILLANGAGTINNVTNNTIANITDFSTSTVNTVSVYGISNSGAGNYNFAGNTIRNLTNNCNVPSASFLLGGIFSTGTGINTYSQNNIYSFYALGTGAGAQLVGGILAGGTTGGTVSRNKIFDFQHLGTGTLAPAPLLLGINVQSSGQYTVSNNMVSLTNGEPTTDSKFSEMIKSVNNENNKVAVIEVPNTAPIGVKDKEGFASDQKNTEKPITKTDLDGVNDNNSGQSIIMNKEKDSPLSTVSCSIAGVYASSTSPGPCYYYYNTFYIGGSQPAGVLNSWAFIRTSTGALSLRNNLFINARTGGGNHFALGNNNANPVIGWTSTSSNYNSLITSNAGTIGEWGIGASQNIGGWTTNSGGDKQTWSSTTASIVPTALLTNVATCDLSILSGNASAWVVSGKGIALTGQNIDYNGDTRVTTIAGGVTDIGADEFVATPPSNPVATQVGVPGAGATSTYTLYGRTICTIEWGPGGSSYPTSMNVNYYSGINPSPAITSPNRNSNSYWTVNPASGTLTGTTYSITLFFGDNETYNITSPSTNTLLAKYGTFWQVFPEGIGNQFSLRDWNNLTLTTGGLNTFSTFALSDEALPSIELVSPANDTVTQIPTTTLVWKRAAGSTLHRVVLATDSTFATGIIKDTVTADTTKAISGLVLNTSYWWRVYGTNGIGTGAYSQIFKFRYTILLTPPPPPVLSSPPNNSTAQPIALNLVWFKAVTATSYRIQLATDSTFATGLVVNDSTLTDSVRAVSGLNYSTNYWWRVNAKNSAGTSTYSPVWKFTTMPLPPALVNLTVIPGGFFNTGTNQLNMKDTITVYLVDSVSCLKVDSSRGVVDSVNFGMPLSFSNAATGNYYMIVYHRNHLGVATMFKQSIVRGSSVSYDFTTDSSKAFGFNMVKVSTSPVRWAMIPGDANRDGFIDALDQLIWIAQNGLDGYLAADFNGDGFVDALDQVIWITYNGLGSFLPCGFTLDPGTQSLMQNAPNYDAKRSNRIMFEKKTQDNRMKNDTKQDNNNNRK